MYSEAHMRVKKHARHDKREAVDQLAAEAEEVAVRGEQGRVFFPMSVGVFRKMYEASKMVN